MYRYTYIVTAEKKTHHRTTCRLFVCWSGFNCSRARWIYICMYVLMYILYACVLNIINTRCIAAGRYFGNTRGRRGQSASNMNPTRFGSSSTNSHTRVLLHIRIHSSANTLARGPFYPRTLFLQGPFKSRAVNTRSVYIICTHHNVIIIII